MNYDPNENVPQASAGIYRFKVKEVEFKSNGVYVTEESDKNGRLYFKPTLAVAIPGNDMTWRCRSLLSTHPRMVHKINHLREMAGQLQRTPNGQWSENMENNEIEGLVGTEGYAKFVPDTSGYNDLEIVDFLPARKIAEMSDAEKAIYDAAVAAYKDDCPISDAEPEHTGTAEEERLAKIKAAQEKAAALTGANKTESANDDIPF